MPELGTYGSVRGAAGNSRPYRDRLHRALRAGVREALMDVIAGNWAGRFSAYGDSALAMLAVICIRLRLVPRPSTLRPVRKAGAAREIAMQGHCRRPRLRPVALPSRHEKRNTDQGLELSLNTTFPILWIQIWLNVSLDSPAAIMHSAVILRQTVGPRSTKKLARRISMARSAQTTRMPHGPIPRPVFIAKGRARKPSSASWATLRWRTATAWWSTPTSPRPTAMPNGKLLLL
jgi:hypothetical protein